MGRLYVQQQEYDVNLDAHYGFPSTSDWILFKGETDANSYLFIRGVGAPGANHNNAPLGSIYVDVTNLTMHMKDATGANWSTFTQTT